MEKLKKQLEALITEIEDSEAIYERSLVDPWR